MLATPTDVVPEMPNHHPRDVQVQEIAAQTWVLRSRTWEQLKFEVEYARQQGTTANSYLIQADKVVLIDPPGASFTDIYLDALAQCIPFEQIDFVVVQHVNPNRITTLQPLLQQAPQARIVCSKPAAIALKQVMPAWEKRLQVVRNGDVLRLSGDRELKFSFVPTPRWADMLCTYDPITQILYTDKLFGAHLCTDELWDGNWQQLKSDRHYYFECLFAAQAKQTEAALAKLTDFPAQIYGPGHGPLIRYSLSRLKIEYLQWCQQQQQKVFSVALLYASAYGNTATAAASIAQGLIESDIQVRSINCEQLDALDLATVIEDSDGFIIGSPTLGGHAPVQIQTALGIVLSTAAKHKPVGVFGSYGWSGEAIDQIEGKLKDASFRFGFETLRIRFTPTTEMLQTCQQAGLQFAKTLQKQQKVRTFSRPLVTAQVDRTAQAMGRVIGSLCVITMQTGEGYCSFLTSWVSQASFHPPGIMLAISKYKGLDAVTQPGTSFVLNLLQENKTLRRHFSRDRVCDPTLMPDLEVTYTEQGGLFLNESVAYLECKTQQRSMCGDHWLLYATVEHGKVLDILGQTAIHHRSSGRKE